MEKITSILNSIKDRLSNPLIFSFICSWIVFNWQIVVSLLWYDTNQIKNTGYNSVFEFINSNLNRRHSLLYPLGFAAGYTFVMPIISTLIKAFNAKIGKWSNNWNLSILKGGQISIDKYLNLRQDYERRTKTLEGIIKKDSETITKLSEAQSEIQEFRESNNNLFREKIELENFKRNVFDHRRLNGYWTNYYWDTVNVEFKGQEDIYIDNGVYYLVKEFGKKEQVFNIRNYHYNEGDKTVYFIKERSNQIKAYEPDTLRFNVNNLKFEREDLLIGIENGTVNIQYKKITAPEQKEIQLKIADKNFIEKIKIAPVITHDKKHHFVGIDNEKYYIKGHDTRMYIINELKNENAERKNMKVLSKEELDQLEQKGVLII